MPTLLLPNWKQLFGIDLRSLALFRILIAFSCITEVLYIWPDSFVFFDDRGLYPRSEAISWNAVQTWSLYYFSGHILWARFLLCLTLLASVALLIGFHTRWAIAICWVLMASYTIRILAVTSGAHMVLPALLFWGMFLPLNATFSVDAALNTIPPQKNLYLSGATFALLIQMTCLYLFSALLKIDSAWNVTGDAIYYVLNTASQPSILGVYLAQCPTVLHYLTLYVYYVELMAVFFLFFPYYNALCRIIILPFLISLHLGFLIFMAIGTFPLICLSGLMIFIPGKAWDLFLNWFNHLPKRNKIALYYDEPCEFCRKTCLIFKELGLPPQTPIVPAQHYPDTAPILDREQSWIVKKSSGEYLTHWKAVAWCWRRSPLLWPLGILFLPPFMQKLGGKIYQLIAYYRPQLASLSARFLPFTAKRLDFKPWKLTQFLMIIIITLIVMSHIDSVIGNNKNFSLAPADQKEYESFITHHSDGLLRAIGLKQKMDFFAPIPLQSTRWVTLEGVLENGQVIDLLRHTNQPAPFKKPRNGYDTYPNHFWLKFFDRINYNKVWEKIIGDYYCRYYRANSSIASVRLSVYEQRTVLPGKPVPLVTRRAKIDYQCPLEAARHNG